MFTARLEPLAEAAATPQPAPPASELPRPAAPALRILIAEDNPVNQLVARRTLQAIGYDAAVVADGAEALAALDRERIDVVLLDVQMPEVDGLEVARRVVARHPHRSDRPWMIALTANAVAGDREACLRAGMDDYLTKPLKRAELEDALRRAAAARSPSEA
jgi:CheY-like chemotaxis protein